MRRAFRPRTLGVTLDRMSDPDESPGYIRLTADDFKAMEELFREFRDARRLYLESVLSMTDRAIKSNESGAHYYERLVVLDGGTIALSLTLLGALISHLPGGGSEGAVLAARMSGLGAPLGLDILLPPPSREFS